MKITPLTSSSIVGLFFCASFQQHSSCCCYGWTPTSTTTDKTKLDRQQQQQQQQHDTRNRELSPWLSVVPHHNEGRRQILQEFIRGVSIGTVASSSSFLGGSTIAWATDGGDNHEDTSSLYQFENRHRNKNKDALIRDDYWFMAGKCPPRKLNMESMAGFNDPKWNTWGACQTESTSGGSGAGNSCTYVSLKQRIPGYSKYAFNVRLGRQEYQELGHILSRTSNNTSSSSSSLWTRDVARLLADTAAGTPCPAVDALLKGTLLATVLLTSPNYSGPPLELLVARFYLNEANFAIQELQRAVERQDLDLAMAAYDFGRDSWNSYFSIVNRAIVPKVGDKFELLQG